MKEVGSLRINKEIENQSNISKDQMRFSSEEVHDSCAMCTYMKISQLLKETKENKEV